MKSKIGQSTKNKDENYRIKSQEELIIDLIDGLAVGEERLCGSKWSTGFFVKRIDDKNFKLEAQDRRNSRWGSRDAIIMFTCQFCESGVFPKSF